MLATNRSLVRILRQCTKKSFPAGTAMRSCRYFASGFSDGDNDPHTMFREQLKELQEEREALYGFTAQEEEAWSSIGASNTSRDHGAFQEAVEEARQAQVAAEAAVAEEKQAATQAHHQKFTHVSADGKSVSMVDVGEKKSSRRIARARTKVVFPPEVMEAFSTSSNEMVGPKGPVFETAKLAGIMAAKKTSDLIPLCHPLPLEKVQVDIQFEEENTVLIECECRVFHKTGVEMEALTGATVAALTVYDMVKAVSHRVHIADTYLVTKSGGKRNVSTDGMPQL